MAGLCEGGNEPPGSLKAICKVVLVKFMDTNWFEGMVILTFQSTEHTGMTDTKLTCSLAGRFLWASVERFQNPSRCSCSVLLQALAGGFPFWMLPVASSRTYPQSTAAMLR
ncbi:hypothetical protein ANN_24172 [Periplaneta americana]|uniref:Uncharacterized protein n=1 Tax=Periplaneta americana TaxID=6978 RepID=A0ABQ8S2E0_PERAM|nr:hypothetical protein ANN_24172 [Periplaneta americana]